MYTTETVRPVLQWMANGGPWRSELSPEPGMPSAATNPAHSGGALAAQVDVERAYCALLRTDWGRQAAAALLREGRELLYSEIGVVLGCSDVTASAWATEGLDLIVEFANLGQRCEGLATPPSYREVAGRPSDRRTASPMAGYPWVDPIVVDDSLAWGPQCPNCHLTTPVSGPCSC